MADKSDRLAAVGRAFWSGTITFGLVSIPVDLFAAERPRATSMRMVDAQGRALGRRYFCTKDGTALDQDDIVRGFETKSGKVVVVTDAELAAIAPEESRDIDLRQFVPLDQIPRAMFNRPYFLLPSGRSTKAYHLLAKTLERAGKAGIATFVMREKAYVVAIVAERGVLRAETMRFASELRTPEQVGLPPPRKPAAASVKKFANALRALVQDELDEREMSDWYATEIRNLVESKHKKGQDVVEMPDGAEAEDGDEAPSAEVVDLVRIIKERLAKGASVTRALEQARSGNKRRKRDRKAA